MKDIREGNCPLCDHDEIVRARPSNSEQPGSSLYALTYKLRRRLGIERPDPKVPRGVMYTCTCRRCGYTQWFVLDPEQVPIEEEHHQTVLVRGRPRGAYR